MHPKDIIVGEMYLFQGQPFKVVRKERVLVNQPYRPGKPSGLRKVLRFFNENGVGVKADELYYSFAVKFETSKHLFGIREQQNEKG